MWSRLVTQQIIRRKTGDKLVRAYCNGPPLKLLRKYEHFQKDNGIPVYIKGGVMDKVLFGITLVGIVIGLSDGFWTLFQMAKPKKK